jgi:peptidoglycan/LPS O-acetylase OafA/YrhL
MIRLAHIKRLAAWLGDIRFRRIVTSNRFIPEVDGFRFLAIMIVVISHVYVQCGPVPTGSSFASAFHRVFEDGKRGVYLFFTISGFILALPFARNHLQQGHVVNLKSYFRRRITRLEPPYIIAMVGRFLILIAYKSKFYTFDALLMRLIASLFYVHGLVYAQYPVINPPAWSLEVEIQFYILAPVLASVFAIRSKLYRRSLLLLLIAVAGIFSAHVISPHARPSLTLLNFSQYFLAGFLLADLYLTDDLPRLPPFLWDAAGFAALGWILLSQSPIYLILLPFFTIALYLAGFKGKVLRSLFSLSPISAIGGMCYSLYLTHSTILTLMTPYTRMIEHLPLADSLQLTLIFLPCLVAVLFAGSIFYLLIEQPCMAPDWPNRLAQKLGGSKTELPQTLAK